MWGVDKKMFPCECDLLCEERSCLSILQFVQWSKTKGSQTPSRANPLLAKRDEQRSSDQHNWREIRHIQRKSVGGSAVRWGCVRLCVFLREGRDVVYVSVCGEQSRSECTKTHTHAQEPTETETAFQQRLRDYSYFHLHPSWGERLSFSFNKSCVCVCVFNCCWV